MFADLDRAAELPDVILATNTSSIPIVQVAQATTRPDRVVGLHFFNPVPVQRLVEVIPSVLTSPQAVLRVTDLVTKTLGKTVIKALLGRKSGRGFYDYQGQN